MGANLGTLRVPWDDPLISVRWSYYRAGGGWNKLRIETEEWRIKHAAKWRGKLVPLPRLRRLLLDMSWWGSGVHLDPALVRPAPLPLGDLWSRFFPDVDS